MEKAKSIVIVVLVILVLVLGGMLIYSNVDSNNDNDVNINNENNNANDNETVNNNEQNKENIYGDIKQLYPTLLEVSTSECLQYISEEELGDYVCWINEVPVDIEVEQENKFKNVPQNVKDTLDYFGLLIFDGGAARGFGIDRYTTTSQLKEKNNTFYGNNLRVEKFNKAWSEGVEGNGIGEKIKYQYMFLRCGWVEDEYGQQAILLLDNYSITMKEFCNIQYNYLKKDLGYNIYDDLDSIDDCYFLASEIIIENGYCKTKELWEKNGRVKTLKLTFEDGEEYILNLEDTMKPQSFKLEHKTNGIREPLEATFEILDVYEGTKYDDTCITTLELMCDRYGIHGGI